MLYWNLLLVRTIHVSFYMLGLEETQCHTSEEEISVFPIIAANASLNTFNRYMNKINL